MAQEINISKEAVPEIISYGESTTITYMIRNLTVQSITSLTLEDSLFKMPGIHVRVLSGGIYHETDGIVALTLPTGGLRKNAIFYCTVIITPSSNARPSQEIYSTYGIICGIANNNPKSTFCDSARCKLFIQGAHITITNSVKPEGPRYIGDLVTFTIEIVNNGNTEAKITPKNFIDSWTDKRLTNISLSDPRFSIGDSYIYNNQLLHLFPGDIIALKLYATIQ